MVQRVRQESPDDGRRRYEFRKTAAVRGSSPADTVTDIAKAKYVITKPTFFGAALKDVVGVAALGKQVHAQLCVNTTIVDFDTGHWVQNALPDIVNKELLKWIKTVEA